MAKVRWKGGAAIQGGQWTLTVGGVAAAAQDYTVGIGLRSIKYTSVGGDTNNSIASELQALLSASTWGEFAENTFTVSNNVITVDGPESGAPVILTPSATGTGTLTLAETITPSSPNDIAIAANYDTGSLPVATDDVSYDHSSFDALWNLDHFAGVAFNSLRFAANFERGDNGSGTAGLPEVNSTGAEPYVEYRPTYFQSAAATCIVGDGPGNGSGRLKLDFGAAQVSLSVHATGSSDDTDTEALLVKGDNVNNTASIMGGDVAIAGLGGETATFALTVGAGAAGAPTLRTGAGATIPTLNMTDGTVLCETAPTTVNKNGGTLSILEGDVTTLTARSGAAGTTAYLGTGTIATIVASEIVDFSQDGRNRTVTNATLLPGGGFLDPHRSVTWTNGFTLSQCGISEVGLDWGKNVKVQLTNL